MFIISPSYTVESNVDKINKGSMIVFVVQTFSVLSGKLSVHKNLYTFCETKQSKTAGIVCEVLIFFILVGWLAKLALANMLKSFRVSFLCWEETHTKGLTLLGVSSAIFRCYSH